MKTQFDYNHKHRAEVIEIYENGLRAAVKFYCSMKRAERIECVDYNGTAGNPDKAQIPFEIGQKGMVDFVRCLNGWKWTFVPSEKD